MANELEGARFRALRDMLGRTLVVALGATTGLGIIYLIEGYEPFTFLGLLIGMTAPWLIIGLYRCVRPEAQLRAEAKQRDRREGRNTHSNKAFWIVWGATLAVFLSGGVVYLLVKLLSG